MAGWRYMVKIFHMFTVLTHEIFLNSTSERNLLSLRGHVISTIYFLTQVSTIMATSTTTLRYPGNFVILSTRLLARH